MEECGPRSIWTGYTEFNLKEQENWEKHVKAWMVKKSSDEVEEKDISPEEWPMWKESDRAEWSKVEQTGAVKALSIEESASIEEQLKEIGKSNRILPSRMVRRWKPSEHPGVPATRKTRWCIRGNRDPDLLPLNRYAPTVTTAVVNIALQVAANRGFKTYVADLRNAFMQSDRLVRNEGRLFCRQPKGGLPGLKPTQLIEVLAGAYGLGDAPAHWRKSLRNVLLELGYEQSVMDPCTFKYFGHDGQGHRELQGLVIVEVDDLLCLGNEGHDMVLERLRERFNFGKFANLQEQPEGASFNGRWLKRTKEGFEIDMTKFVRERLHPVPFKLDGRKKEDEANLKRKPTPEPPLEL